MGPHARTARSLICNSMFLYFNLILILDWQAEEMEEDHLTPEQLATLKEIRARKGVIVRAHRMKKAVANNQAVLPRRADAGRTATTRNLKASACLACASQC